MDDSLLQPIAERARRRSESDNIRVARTPEEVERLRPFWAVQPTNRDGDIDFYAAVVLSRPEVVRPHVISIEREGVPRAMLIGRLEYKPAALRVGYFRVRLPALRSLIFVDGGTLHSLDAQDAAKVVGCITASLSDGEAELAVFDQIDIEHPLSRSTLAMPPRLCADRLPVPNIHYRRTLHSDRPLLACLSANERNNQRRREKRLQSHFQEVRVECFHTAGNLDTLCRDAEAVARNSYQRGLGVGFADTPQMRRRLEFEAHKGTLRGHVLYAAGKPCAFWIASLYRGVLNNDFMAFDPSYGKYAPGVFLALKVMEEVSRDPVAGLNPVVDFGVGEAEWKARLADHSSQAATLTIFAPRPKPITIKLLQRSTYFLHAAGVAALQRTWLLPQVKRFMRRKAAGR